MTTVAASQELACSHCSAMCREPIETGPETVFCCAGCRAVYELLHQADLGAYYRQQSPPGLKPADASGTSRLAYLDDAQVQRQLISFSDGRISRVLFSVPQMHCASCIWLLENLFRLDPAVTSSHVNFLWREIVIHFDQSRLSLRKLVELLARLGYEPQIRLGSLEQPERRNPRAALHLKIGVAGFSFANIMLLSFPEYLGPQELAQTIFPLVFRIAVILLSLPVLVYSASGYFSSAWYSLRSRRVNIDVPLALGMAALFGRSIYDIAIHAGPGFLDSFTGLVFFLLLGKLFQQHTFEQLAFDRDYKAYFPASVTRKTAGNENSIPVAALRVGDRIVVRNQELVSADSILVRGDGLIDYSFVTGESLPRAVTCGDLVYAGGRQVGTAIELEVIKEVSQSYLTSLWNNPAFGKEAGPGITSIADRFGRHFTAILLVIAAATALFWLRRDPGVAVNAVTAVLIVACPCALALSSPFVFGAALRILGRQKLYLKNTAAIESMAAVDTIVFDKTGTLTFAGLEKLAFEGSELSAEEIVLVKSLARHSTHPVSRRIEAHFAHPARPVQEFTEEPGTGISGVVEGHTLRLGRYSWAMNNPLASANEYIGSGTVTYLSIDNQLRGRFVTSNSIRPNLETTIHALRSEYALSVLSGDNDRDRDQLCALFNQPVDLRFNQSPHDKLARVRELRESGKQVLMVGDGLNDSGALRAATVGIAVSEAAICFTPACDGILEASHVDKLDRYLVFARASRSLVVASIGISILYNVIGLAFAASGHLSPLVSAILMPVSSVSVIAFAAIATPLAARRSGVN